MNTIARTEVISRLRGLGFEVVGIPVPKEGVKRPGAIMWNATTQKRVLVENTGNVLPC